MALIKCKECGGGISTEAINCPSCGFQIPRKCGSLLKTGIILFPILFYWLVLVGNYRNRDKVLWGIYTAIAFVFAFTYSYTLAVNKPRTQAAATISDAVRVVPEMIFTIKPNYLICSNEASLMEISAHIDAGEKSLANAMLRQNNFDRVGGTCIQSQDVVSGAGKIIPDNSKWKVLSVHSNIIEFTIAKTNDIPLVTILLSSSSFWAAIEIVKPFSGEELAQVAPVAPAAVPAPTE